MEWQTLAELAKGCAALPKETFKARFTGPFLLEISPEAGEEVAGNETRIFDPARVKNELAPSLQASRIVYFGDGSSFAAGRNASCEISCRHTTVSETHARFESFGSIWSIKDEGSKNGTMLNGRRLNAQEQCPLKFGTKITFGEAQFLFLGTDDAFDLVQELCKEPRIRPKSLGKYRAEFAEAGTADQVIEHFPGPFLVVQAPKGRDGAGDPKGGVSTNTITLSAEELTKSVNKNVTDAVFDLSKHSLVRIGRATVTQIHLPLGAISNLHSALVREDGGNWSIQDLGAKNGTYLWGERLEDKKILESGTEIMLGNIKSIFFSTEDLVTYALHRDTLV